MKNNIRVFMTSLVFISTFVLCCQSEVMAGTKPSAVKSKMESCADAVENLEEASDDFLDTVNRVKATIDQPVDEQAELSNKQWQKLITKPRSEAWRKEKDELKAAVKAYQTNCKGITKAIKNMEKPAE
ncbi:hypothetical protein [Candidatus Venteria ishoeyi]|nr:hypothetical protein [Candidatus Venteria ishoeyi]